MEQESKMEKGRQHAILRSSGLFSIVLGLLAVVSPLFINHMSTTDEDLEEESTSLSSFLPLLLLVLIVAVSISGFVDKGLTTFDPHWIHRFGGSSIGILTILMVLALVLKCKAFG
ncbi:hypothetical protein Leryth_015520 [Lithospermum erythrorhizon]|nr:hypothetical protein Leryth_015520 [Lithospermum erythrorhizon]